MTRNFKKALRIQKEMEKKFNAAILVLLEAHKDLTQAIAEVQILQYLDSQKKRKPAPPSPSHKESRDDE